MQLESPCPAQSEHKLKLLPGLLVGCSVTFSRDKIVVPSSHHRVSPCHCSTSHQGRANPASVLPWVLLIPAATLACVLLLCLQRTQALTGEEPGGCRHPTCTPALGSAEWSRMEVLLST
jgi:hypothetical protein